MILFLPPPSRAIDPSRTPWEEKKRRKRAADAPLSFPYGKSKFSLFPPFFLRGKGVAGGGPLFPRVDDREDGKKLFPLLHGANWVLVPKKSFFHVRSS